MINLYFTDDEMKTFLTKKGFTIKTVKAWKSYNTYHNQVEDNEFDIEVAFTDGIHEFNSPNGSYRFDSIDKYKIKNVFTDVLKSNLLGL
jgi:hypothetical protein